MDNRLLARFPYDPHPEQVKAMRAIRSGLHHGGVTIIESPTGTGKTLMLLTACLDYMKYYLDDGVFAGCGLVGDGTDIVGGDGLVGADIVVGGDGGGGEMGEKIGEQEGEPEWIKRHRALLEAEGVGDSVDGKWGRKRARRRNEGPTTSVQKLLAMLPSSDSDPESGETVNEYLNSIPVKPTSAIKLVYASRTHSQLKQVLGELKKVNHESLTAIVLGGRHQLCINTSVNDGRGDIAERCNDLVDSEAGCPFWRQRESVGNVRELVERVSKMAVVDIEEAVGVGRQCRACPYHTLKHLNRRIASITLCPYPLLFSPSSPSQDTLNLDKNTIVVIDEAHNLQDFINQSESKLVTLGGLSSVLEGLQKYLNRYGRRLSGLNLASAQQLQFVIGNLVKFMADGAYMSGGGSMGVLQFSQSCSIDTINLVKLVDYTRTSRLAYKLDHDTRLLFEAVEFLGKLSEGSENGRILVCDGDPHDRGLGSPTPHPPTPHRTIKYVNIKASTVMEPIVERCRAVILAGGTMSPISDTIDGLFPATPVHHHSFAHLLSHDRFAVSLVARGPGGHKIDCRLDNRGDAGMWADVGSVLVNFARITPGCMCVFFASFPLLQQALVLMADAIGTLRSMRSLFVEERERGAAGVEAMLRDYTATPKACLFAVIGGRLSEGVNLGDDLCRTMVVVGMPYLNERDVEVAERIRFGGGGSRFVHNQCMRKVNQTIGRALRHAHDYAYIVLLDGRYEQVCKDLPAWMQPSISTCSFPAAYSRAVQFFKKQLLG